MFPDFVRRGYCTDLRACQPISVAGYAYERTRPNGRNLNLDKFEWIVVGSFGRRQTDLVVIVAFVHRFCRERLWQSVPLRRTRCRFDSVEFLRHVTKFRNNNRLLVILSWSNFIDVFFQVSNKGTKFISCRSMEYCAETYFTESPVQTENLAGCNEQVWTTGVDIYICIKLRWRLNKEGKCILKFENVCLSNASAKYRVESLVVAIRRFIRFEAIIKDREKEWKFWVSLEIEMDRLFFFFFFLDIVEIKEGGKKRKRNFVYEIREGRAYRAFLPSFRRMEKLLVFPWSTARS